MPATTRAARLHAHGRPLTVEPVELRTPGEGEIAVELRFAGVNPVDGYVAEGRVAPDGPLPRTLGGEAAGTADGRPVLVAGEGLGAARDGVWAQRAIVPEAAVIPLPEDVGPREAAAMGVAGLTAWKVVHEVGAVTAEDRVLVLGASGGVGTMIVSLAAASGATVWGQTGSSEKSELVERQGADRAIVAGAEDVAEAVAELEPTVVFDPLGDGFVAPMLDALSLRGRLVSFGTSAGPDVQLNMQTLYRKMLSICGYAGLQLGREERRAGLETALEALRAGELKVVIDEVLPLEQVNEAFERITRRQVQGKLLLGMAE
ncbi:MAG: zinc-binding alcohol dehydrogenase family protein [Solirubrobacterales bacterium]|nr:zinc-binding alcohol dehydrogenase family protein [Solirubrobacterales bacterium]